jgi:hypothetical protein
MLEYIVHYGVVEFTKIIASYHDDDGRSPITRSVDTEIHHDICANMFKAVLLPCMSECNIGITRSEFVQELLIKLLYVIPNIKALILPPAERPNYMKLFVERIQILTHLQEFRFNVGCTTEIIIELSKYCPHMKKLCVEESRRVDDVCVEHLLKLRHLRVLNIVKTSISTNGYSTLLSNLPLIQDIVWFSPIDPVLRELTVRLPSVMAFAGKVSAAELLVQNCPNITELVLVSPTTDMSDLGELKSVAALSISLSNCTVIGFRVLIRELGPNLTILEMHQVRNLNFDDLINYCIVLNSLRIGYCHITYTETFDRELPHFRNLKELELRHNWGPFDFSSVLHLYANLNVLHAVGMRKITDAFVSEIVTAGGFRNLIELVVDHCGYMSIETAL